MPMLRLSGPASCPAHRASTFLERFLEEHAGGRYALFALRPALTFAALPELTLVHDCIVRLEAIGRGPAGARTAISWRLADDDDAVRFDGTLTVARAETGPACALVLRGRYPAAPLGVAPVERRLTRRIAESTGRAVLACLTGYLAASYRSAETAERNRETAAR